MPGLEVLEHPGWQTRGQDMGSVQGVLCHHLPDMNVLADGRPDLGCPLCNIGLGR